MPPAVRGGFLNGSASFLLPTQVMRWVCFFAKRNFRVCYLNTAREFSSEDDGDHVRCDTAHSANRHPAHPDKVTVARVRATDGWLMACWPQFVTVQAPWAPAAGCGCAGRRFSVSLRSEGPGGWQRLSSGSAAGGTVSANTPPKSLPV